MISQRETPCWIVTSSKGRDDCFASRADAERDITEHGWLVDPVAGRVLCGREACRQEAS